MLLTLSWCVRQLRDLENKPIKLKEPFESKDQKTNLGRSKVMVTGYVTKHGLSQSNAYLCGVCSFTVKDNSV